MRCCCDGDLLLDCNLESLRVRRGRNQKRTVAERLPLSFQARQTATASTGNPVLQNLARRFLRNGEKLDARLRKI